MKNTYNIGDAIDFVTSLKGQISGIATSPPYNKQFKNRGAPNWKNSKLQYEQYSHYDDNMPDDEYVKWQQEFIAACVECVGDEGVVIYNIGRRIKNLREDSRYEIIKNAPLRQTVIWNRGSSHNQGGSRPTILPPIYELIYIIAGNRWKLPEKHVKEMLFWGDVWRINPARGNPHPAPFPLEIATRMAMLVDGPIADPFAGSGTMGIAAHDLDLDYYLNDLLPEYKQMFEERLAKHIDEKNDDTTPLLAKRPD